MSPELENKLYEDFPVLFENRNKSPQQSCLAFGIECGDGWYDIIRSVCWEIKQHEENVSRQNKWQLEKDPNYESNYIPVKFDQIKEKFGGLRIYFSGGDDRVRGIVGLAEEMSYKLCEVCGNKGRPNEGGWISTLCDAHRKS